MPGVRLDRFLASTAVALVPDRRRRRQKRSRRSRLIHQPPPSKSAAMSATAANCAVTATATPSSQAHRTLRSADTGILGAGRPGT